MRPFDRPGRRPDPLKKLNCWEYRKCGRSPEKPDLPGVGACPVPGETRADSVNGGRNGGRVCWTIAGTLCDGEPHGDYATKLANCLKCDFCQQVLAEELITIRVDAATRRRLGIDETAPAGPVR